MAREILKMIFISHENSGTTGYIDELYESSMLIEFTGLSDALTCITPFTVYSIPRWKILGGLGGLTIE